MEQISADATHNRIDRKFVGSAVHAQLVGTAEARNGEMFAQGCFKVLEISFVIDSFLELADEPWRQADDIRHSALLQFHSEEEMLQRACRGIGLIYRDLDLKGT